MRRNTFILIAVPMSLSLAGTRCNGPIELPESDDYPLHRDITTTVFWIGEPGTADNDFIPNDDSTWDEQWLEHYGGVDSPDDRDGFLPAGFVPNENPFYCALPYNDIADDGTRKPDAFDVVYWADDQNWTDDQSMCKNRWVRITKGDQVAYAQWEDAGPFGENDAAYVFGTAGPTNTINDHAGLDVSPAVRDYLELSGLDKLDWQFVREVDVPDGPWKQIITTSDTCH